MSNPSLEEIAGWCEELALWFDGIAKASHYVCANELNLKRAIMWRDRAAQIRAMAQNKPTCRTCKYYPKSTEMCHCDKVPGVLYPIDDFYCRYHKDK